MLPKNNLEVWEFTASNLCCNMVFYSKGKVTDAVEKVFLLASLKFWSELSLELPFLSAFLWLYRYSFHCIHIFSLETRGKKWWMLVTNLNALQERWMWCNSKFCDRQGGASCINATFFWSLLNLSWKLLVIILNCNPPLCYVILNAA